jgi:uncharacterized protein involved in response to NO
MQTPLLSQGFRPFFLLVGLWAVIALAAWIAMLEGGLALPSRFAPMDWHIHEMLFGLVMAAVAGFLLTAIPNWTARLPVSGAPLALLVGLWLLGRVDMAVSAWLPLAASIAADLAFTAYLAFVAAREIAAGRNWKHLTVIIPLALLFCGNLAMHLAAAGAEVPADLGWRLAMAAIAFLVALIGGRIIPSFTRNWLKKNDLPEPKSAPVPVTAGALITLAAGMLAWAFLPQSRPVGALLCLSALLHLALLAGWTGGKTWPEKLLFILHVGYGWLVVGLALLGVSCFELGVPQSAAVHALTAGAFAVMILAVMTRASRGHTGRPLTADGATKWIYLCVNLAALTRIAAALISSFATYGLRLSALFWIAAFGLFVFNYGPILWSPRPHAIKE